MLSHDLGLCNMPPIVINDSPHISTDVGKVEWEKGQHHINDHEK